jgi:hypothetical protein
LDNADRSQKNHHCAGCHEKKIQEHFKKFTVQEASYPEESIGQQGAADSSTQKAEAVP